MKLRGTLVKRRSYSDHDDFNVSCMSLSEALVAFRLSAASPIELT